MNKWVDGGTLAGLSAALTFFFVIGSAGMGFLIWRYRNRFKFWLRLSARDRADGLLNISIFGILLNAAFQRGNATYSFLNQDWRLTPLTMGSAPFYLIWTLIFMSGLLWWLCLELFGPSQYHQWWWVFMATGAALAAIVIWMF